eukprot:5934418-Amphidinium_carterae.1
MDLSSWALDKIVAPCIKSFKTKSIFWIGRAGCGKTPSAAAIANTLSSYWQHKQNPDVASRPLYKTAAHLDFFRGEKGLKNMPYIFDDGN